MIASCPRTNTPEEDQSSHYALWNWITALRYSFSILKSYLNHDFLETTRFGGWRAVVSRNRGCLVVQKGPPKFLLSSPAGFFWRWSLPSSLKSCPSPAILITPRPRPPLTTRFGRNFLVSEAGELEPKLIKTLHESKTASNE